MSLKVLSIHYSLHKNYCFTKMTHRSNRPGQKDFFQAVVTNLLDTIYLIHSFVHMETSSLVLRQDYVIAQ